MDFNKENYTTHEAIEERIKEIKGLVERSNSAEEIEAFTEELGLLQERDAELADLEQRKAAVKEVETGARSTTVTERGTAMPNNAMNEFNYESPEYRSAWLKRMATDSHGNMMLGELTDIEQRAFTFTTANSGSLVPKVTLDRIVDLVKAEAPMLEDADISELAEGFAIPVRTAIAGGDAKAVAEGAANDDEQDTFKLISMPGVDIKKHAIMTRRMKFQSIDSFENWLVADISKRIAVAKETVLRTRLDGGDPLGGSTYNTDVAIASGNVLTNQPYTDAAIRNIMSLIDENGQVAVYANRSTIYNGLAGIQTGDGKKAFIESAMVDPTVKGVIYGAVVKVDANLADDVAYFGVVGALKGNDYAPLEIFPTVEAKTANIIFTGTEVFDGGLENPKAFVKVTFSAGGESE